MDFTISGGASNVEDFGGAIYNFNRFTFNPSNLQSNKALPDLDSLLVSPVKAKKLTNKDQTLEQMIRDLKRKQEIQKQAKKEMGEKRILCQQTVGKGLQTEMSDDEVSSPVDEEEEETKKGQETRKTRAETDGNDQHLFGNSPVNGSWRQKEEEKLLSTMSKEERLRERFR